MHGTAKGGFGLLDSFILHHSYGFGWYSCRRGRRTRMPRTLTSDNTVFVILNQRRTKISSFSREKLFRPLFLLWPAHGFSKLALWHCRTKEQSWRRQKQLPNKICEGRRAAMTSRLTSGGLTARRLNTTTPPCTSFGPDYAALRGLGVASTARQRHSPPPSSTRPLWTTLPATSALPSPHPTTLARRPSDRMAARKPSSASAGGSPPKGPSPIKLPAPAPPRNGAVTTGEKTNAYEPIKFFVRAPVTLLCGLETDWTAELTCCACVFFPACRTTRCVSRLATRGGEQTRC